MAVLLQSAGLEARNNCDIMSHHPHFKSDILPIELGLRGERSVLLYWGE